MLFVVFSFFQNLNTSFNHTSWLLIEFPGMSAFVLPADELSEEEEAREVTKKECELGVATSWMEVGGLPALAEEEAQGL